MNTPTPEKIEFDITKLVIDTYNKVAMWNNSDFDNKKHQSDALKVISQDIVQSILDALMETMGAEGKTEVYRGDKKVGDISSKDSSSFANVDEKSIFDKLFTSKQHPNDAEIVKEEPKEDK